MKESNTLGMSMNIEKTTQSMCGIGQKEMSKFIMIDKSSKTLDENPLYKKNGEEVLYNKIGKLKRIIH